MERMIFLLIFSGVTSGQFFRFGDSPEDDSREFFGPRNANRNRFNSFEDDSREVFRSRRIKPSQPFFFDSIEDDSDEIFFNSNRHQFSQSKNLFNKNKNIFKPSFSNFKPRNNLQSRNLFLDSDEVLINGNRIDLDSPEDFFGGFRNNRGNSRQLTNSFNTISSFRPNSFGANRFRNTNSNFNNRFRTSLPVNNGFNRNTGFFKSSNTVNRNPFNNRVRFDSVEDLFDDLFDDDLDDRIRAQNALSRLQNNGQKNLFSNRQSFSNSNFHNRFRTNNKPFLASKPSTFTTKKPFTTNQRALNHFSIQQHINRMPTSKIKNSKNGFSFNTRLGSSKTKFSNNKLTSNTFRNKNKFSSSPFKSIKTNRNNFHRNNNNNINTFSNKRSSSSFDRGKSTNFKPPFGLNWSGGSGYYVTMSTGNSKPYSYFVKY